MSHSPWSNPMLPVLKTLRILGRTPFTVDESGRLECRLVSSASLWALLSTAVQAWLGVYVYLSHGFSFDKFSDVLNVASRTMYLNGVLHSLSTTWWATPAIVRAYNRWNDFHLAFERTTNRTVSSKILDHSLVGVVAIVVISATMLMVQTSFQFALYPDHKAYIAVQFVTVCYFLTFLWHWIVLCLMVEKAAEIISESIHESRDIPALRLLWMELRSCAESSTAAAARTTALWLLHFLYGYIVVLYHVVVNVVFHDVSLLPRTKAMPLATGFVYESFCIFAVFLAGSWATDSIHDKVVRRLLEERWSMFSETERCEMGRFLNTVESMGKPYFEILGIFSLDKPEFTTIIETIVTYYLVVLMQFYEISQDLKNMT